MLHVLINFGRSRRKLLPALHTLYPDWTLEPTYEWDDVQKRVTEGRSTWYTLKIDAEEQAVRAHLNTYGLDFTIFDPADYYKEGA